MKTSKVKENFVWETVYLLLLHRTAKRYVGLTLLYKLLKIKYLPFQILREQVCTVVTWPLCLIY